MNTLTGQKAVLAEVRQREFEAYNQVKNSCHMVEQAQLEKAEVCHAEILKVCGANFHLIEPKDVQFTKELSRCRRYKGSQIPPPWFISFFFS